MVLALTLFLFMYVALLVFAKSAPVSRWRRRWGILPVSKVPGAVDWNVILMIMGTMGTVYFFIQSRMPALMADHIIDRMPNVKWVVVALAMFAGIISAFVDNVATVLMVAPVALVVSKKLKISPVPVIIAIAVSSNLQGAATLVGDTTSILLGKQAGMNFLDFLYYHGRPGLFFIVQIGAVLAAATLLWTFAKEKQPVHIGEKTVVQDYFPTWMLGGTIVLLILASFIPAESKPAITNGLICVGVMLVGILRKNGYEVKTTDFMRISVPFTLIAVTSGYVLV